MTSGEESDLPVEPTMAGIDERYPATMVGSPHPAVMDPEELFKRCELRTQRRSGPGGQHRNKTSSGVFLTLNPYGIVGEATERRSQIQNRVVALTRLRFRLAIELRSPSSIDQEVTAAESELLVRFRGSRLKINEENVLKPAVLALILNDLRVAGGQPSLVAKVWATTTSSIVAFLASHPAALVYVNEIRRFHSRRPLKV